MSKFKRRHLDALKDHTTSYTSPLSVIVHIDLDAYYAQCEQIRLGLPPEAPVVCRQWGMLIAVNYPARKYGIKRGDSVDEAKKKCPDLHVPHVATYKKGETEWDWHEKPTTAEHKVSLDPFRIKSRAIFKVFKEYCDTIEKAGIDEAFFDLGGYLYDKITADFPQLLQLDRDDDLPPVPSLEETGLEWAGVMVGEEDGSNSDLKDWDDLCVLYASNRVKEIRQALKEVEKITCSAGIAQNKILAKLGSGKNKPNNQSIVTPSTVHSFLQDFKLTDMWGMGGKYGDRIQSQLNMPQDQNEMEYLQSLSLDDMKHALGQTEGHKVFNLVHGQERSEIVTRTDVKSMQSVKQFGGGGSVATIDDCHQWIRVFAADLANRILELDEELPTPIRPKTVVLGHGISIKKPIKQPKYNQYFQHHSKQQPFRSPPKSASKEKYRQVLFEAGCSLLEQAKAQNDIFPCAMLRLAVTNMEKMGAPGTASLEGFFGKSSLFSNATQSAAPRIATVTPEPHTPHAANDADRTPTADTEPPEDDGVGENDGSSGNDDDDDDLFVTDHTLVTCERCKTKITCHKLDEHMDWHFAKDLEANERRQQLQQQQQQQPKRKNRVSSSASPSKKARSAAPSAKNQKSILNFFKKS